MKGMYNFLDYRWPFTCGRSISERLLPEIGGHHLARFSEGNGWIENHEQIVSNEFLLSKVIANYKQSDLNHADAIVLRGQPTETNWLLRRTHGGMANFIP